MARTIRPANHWQHPKAPIRLVAVAGRRQLARALKEALRHLPELFDVKGAEYLISHGRTREVIDALDMKHFREVLKAVFDKWATIYFAAAELGTRKINGAFRRRGRRVRFGKGAVDGSVTQGIGGLGGNADQIDGPIDIQSLFEVSKAIGDRFNFDRFDQGTLDDLRSAQDELIKDLTSDARDVIENTIYQAQMRGEEAASIVDDIRGVINLTHRQAIAVRNYEGMLRGLDAGALQRQLRNDAFDSAFQLARDSDISLSEAVIDRMVSDYEDNYLDYRAATIAKTESVRAANSGLHEAYSQAIDRGALPDEAVRRFWQIDLTEATCATCLSIPDLNEDGVGVDEDFDSDDGPIDDAPVHPNCACSVDYVTDLDLVPDEEEPAEEEADQEA